MQEQTQPGELHYVIDAELKDTGLVRYGTTFMPEGRVLLRHNPRCSSSSAFLSVIIFTSALVGHAFFPVCYSY